MKNIFVFVIGLAALCGPAAFCQSATPPGMTSNGIIANIKTGAGQENAYQNSTTASPGDTINFEVYVQNAGDTAGQVEVQDTLDSRLTYVPNSSYEAINQGGIDRGIRIKDSFVKMTGQTMRWGFNRMGTRREDAMFLTFKARLADASAFPIGQTVVKNHVIVSVGDRRAITPSARVNVNRSASPVVTLFLRSETRNPQRGQDQWAGDGEQVSVAPGDLVYYRIAVTNEGNIPAQDVLLKDILPTGMTLVGDCKLYQDAQVGVSINAADLTTKGLRIASLLNGTDHAATITFSAKAGPGVGKQNGLTNISQALYNGQVADEAQVSVLLLSP